MPTVLRVGRYRFFFYANDRHEPPHIHVQAGGAVAKFWLAPVRLAHGRNFSRHELSRIRGVVIARHGQLLRSWHEYFDG